MFERTTLLKLEAASTVSDRVRPNRPAFDAAYATAPLPPFKARREEILMMHFEEDEVCEPALTSRDLRPARADARRNAREDRIAPSRFVFNVFVMSSGLVRGKIAEIEIPAALTSMSTPSLSRNHCQP